MRPQFSVYIATSLDGFIARTDGNIGWLYNFDDMSDPNEDYGYAAFTAQIDCMVMGRSSFDTVQAFDDWPYEGKRVIILSNSLKKAPSGYEDKIEICAGSPADLAQQLYKKGLRHIYLDGGKVIQSFLSAGLVDDMIITQLPILIGAGLPLFGDVADDITLKLDWSRTYKNGFVQSRYEVT